MKCDEKRGAYSLIGVLGITVLTLLMLVSIAGAAPFAYIAHNQLSGTVTVIDLATNTDVPVIIPVGGNPQGVAVSPDGTKAYVTNSWSGDVSVIDTATNTVLATIEVGVDPFGVAVSPNGKIVYVANRYTNTVSVIDTATNTAVKEISVGRYPSGVAVSPNGKYVYVTNYISGTVSIIDTATNKDLAQIPVGNNPQGIAVNSDGTKVYVVNSGSSSVFVIDTATNTVTNINVGSFTSPRSIAITPDGKKVYVTTHDPSYLGTVSVIDTATNTVRVLSIDNNGCVGINPDGTKVYVTDGHANCLWIIDSATDTVIGAVGTGSAPQCFGLFIGGQKAIPTTPTITWSNPADITYGTSLSSTQLNAVASVPGTLTYTPPSGTVLNAGTQTLKVDFTPTDIANYNTATQTVTINILTHVQGIQQITAKVQSLNLVPEQANLLIVKLDTATKNLNNGNTLGAATELNAFTNQVNAFINNGKISSSEGKALIYDTNDLIKAMDNIFNFPAASVPEFPSVALPVVAILGLVMIFGRKKE